jgi:ribosomal protein L11 methyltransferase
VNPETPLTIFELRALSPTALDFLLEADPGREDSPDDGPGAKSSETVGLVGKSLDNPTPETKKSRLGDLASENLGDENRGPKNPPPAVNSTLPGNPREADPAGGASDAAAAITWPEVLGRHALPDGLAPRLAGVHAEGDFAFLFFSGDVDLGPFLESRPDLSLRQVHRLRYDQWQDGAGSPALAAGPLRLEQVFSAGASSSSSSLSSPRPSPPGAPEPLLIDPGLAFGFGGHPTTRACLEFLLRLYRPGTLTAPTPETALDLGCGTGVLALAAARLGARKVLGVDHSHLAVDAARHNVRLNGLEARVSVRRGLAQDLAGEPADLVMANIPLFVLADLTALGAFAGRGHLIVSGLLPEEGETFLEGLGAGVSFKIMDSARSDRWVSFLLETPRP